MIIDSSGAAALMETKDPSNREPRQAGRNGTSQEWSFETYHARGGYVVTAAFQRRQLVPPSGRCRRVVAEEAREERERQRIRRWHRRARDPEGRKRRHQSRRERFYSRGG